MDDLHEQDKQLTIFCTFILDPDTIMGTIDEMRKSSDVSQQQRAGKIFDIITSFINDESTFNRLKEADKKDGKMSKVVRIVDTILSDKENPKLNKADPVQ
jgi:signal transduction protein with GAF and PtsI domain